MPSLSCSTWNLWSLLQNVRSLVVAYGLWFSDQGSNHRALHWEHRFLTTGPPGKSLDKLISTGTRELMAFFLEFKMVLFFFSPQSWRPQLKHISSWEPRQNNHIAKAEEGKMQALVFSFCSLQSHYITQRWSLRQCGLCLYFRLKCSTMPTISTETCRSGWTDKTTSHTKIPMINLKIQTSSQDKGTGI